jgi:hypothetical protein
MSRKSKSKSKLIDIGAALSKAPDVFARFEENTDPIQTDHALVVYDQDIKAHAHKIKTSWQKAVSGIIETGQLLIEAKRALPHGAFLKLFDKEIGNLPFGKDAAQRLMKIAKNPVLSNAAYTPFLPASWMTLVVLSRATKEQLELWIIDGTVHAELEQLDAIALVNPPKLHKAAPAQPHEDEPDEDEDEPEEEVTEPLSEEEVAERKARNKAEVALMEAATALKTLNEKLNDADFDWDQVIEAIGPELVRVVLDELKIQLSQYASKDTVH